LAGFSVKGVVGAVRNAEECAGRLTRAFGTATMRIESLDRGDAVEFPAAVPGGGFKLEPSFLKNWVLVWARRLSASCRW